MGLGRVEIISVAAVEAGVFGVLAFGVAAVIVLQVDAGRCVVFVLIVALAVHIERLFCLVGAFEHRYAVFQQCRGLYIPLLLECLLGILKLIVVVIAFLHTLVLSARTEEDEQ